MDKQGTIIALLIPEDEFSHALVPNKEDEQYHRKHLIFSPGYLYGKMGMRKKHFIKID